MIVSIGTMILGIWIGALIGATTWDKMNGKIIKILDTTVYIGYEDGAVKEISRTSLEFKPVLGDPVEVYGDFVTKI